MCVCMEFKVKKIRHATDILAKGESEHYNDHQMDLKGNNLKEVWGGRSGTPVEFRSTLELKF